MLFKTLISRHLILILLFVLGNMSVVRPQQSKWRTKNRLQTSVEFDDNIRESPPDSAFQISAASVKFLAHARASRAGRKTRIVLNYQAGLQGYPDHSLENKLINEAAASSTFRLGRFQLGLQAEGRLKIYLNDVLDYSTGALQATLGLPVIAGLRPLIGIRRAGIDYQNFPSFDYDDTTLDLTFAGKLRGNSTWNIAFSRSRVNYARSLITVRPDGSLFFSEEAQSDLTLGFKASLGYVKKFLINLSYTFRDNDSNGLGFTYTRHQITAVFGMPLSRSIWLRAFAAGQFKMYRDEGPPIFPLDIDTERDESSFFILDLSKDLSANLTLVTRLAYYNNESVIRNRFYQKTLLSTGFDFRF